MWQCWISATFERDENVKRDKTIDLVALLNMWDCWIRYNVNKIRILNLLHFWICGTVEWDMNEKLDNTTEFVTLLNMWECWKRYECEII